MDATGLEKNKMIQVIERPAASRGVYRQESSYLVGNRTGGQGKTLLTQLIHYGHLSLDIPLRVFSADTESSGEGKSKLGQLVADVRELGIGASLLDIEGDGEAAIDHWDAVGIVLGEGRSVIDVGANVLPQILEWGERRKVGRMFRGESPVVLVIPVTSQRQSVVDAYDIVRRAIELQRRGGLAFERIIIVYNEVWGKFDGLSEDREFRRLKFFDDVSVESVTIERCISPVWRQAETGFISIADLVEMGPAGYSEKFGFNKFKANGAFVSFADWLRTQIGSLRRAGLVPLGMDDEDVKDLA